LATTFPREHHTTTGHTIGVASAIWAGSIFLSRIIGLVREQIIGRTLGASRQADIYFASFTLPDFLNYLLAAGALSIVFIPIFLKYLERGEEQRGWQAFSVIANFIVVAGGLGIALLIVFARPLATLVAPGFTDPAAVDTLVRLIRIIVPAQFFHVTGGLLSAALQARDKHALPALAPLIYSLGIIAGGLVGAQLGWGAEGFAWGVLFGSILGPFALPLIGCLKSNMRWYPQLTLRSEDLKTYLWLSIPIMIGFSIVVVDEWIVKNQASYLAPGALSYLQYGRTLLKVPIGVFGMAAGVASYPTISRMVAAGHVSEAYAVLSRAMRLMLLLIFAAQVCLTVCGFEATYLIWGLFSSRFSVADAEATATILVFLSLGLSAWAAQTVISRGFYALGSTWLPTTVGTIIAVVSVPFYVVLRRQLGAIGLAVASSVAITVYVGVIGLLQRRRFEREAVARSTTLGAAPGMLDGFVRMAVAAAVAIAIGLGARQLLVSFVPGIGFAALLIRAVVLCGLGVAAYVASARLLRLDELVHWRDKLLPVLKRRREKG
jgi:putative peptidoglycan lipid II flippase